MVSSAYQQDSHSNSGSKTSHSRLIFCHTFRLQFPEFLVFSEGPHPFPPPTCPKVVPSCLECPFHLQDLAESHLAFFLKPQHSAHGSRMQTPWSLALPVTTVQRQRQSPSFLCVHTDEVCRRALRGQNSNRPKNHSCLRTLHRCPARGLVYIWNLSNSYHTISLTSKQGSRCNLLADFWARWKTPATLQLPLTDVFSHAE